SHFPDHRAAGHRLGRQTAGGPLFAAGTDRCEAAGHTIEGLPLRKGISMSRSLTRRTFLGSTAAAAGAIAAARAKAEPSTGKRLRLAVVGGGFGSFFPWHNHPDAEVVAVSDLRQDRRDHLSRTFKCERVYESLEKLILAKDIDAVAVYTPSPDHA